LRCSDSPPPINRSINRLIDRLIDRPTMSAASEGPNQGKLQRVGLVVLMAANASVGFWAQLFPRSFYDDFQEMGRTWVALDGPFNEHLVRDVGGLNLALAVVAGSALLFHTDRDVLGDGARPLAVVAGSALLFHTPLLGRVAGAAAVAYGLPHLLYHATHLDAFDALDTDAVAMLVSLTPNIIAATLALAPAPTPGSILLGKG